jgi:ATP-dependent Lon protease
MVNIRDFEDLNRSELNKQNKDNVDEFALNMGKLLKNSQTLLKNAATDPDSLKSQQLENQCRLLKVTTSYQLRNQFGWNLVAVKSTVDEKLSSWSSILKKSTGKKVTQKEMTKAVKSAMNESDREYIIMFNLGAG